MSHTNARAFARTIAAAALLTSALTPAAGAAGTTILALRSLRGLSGSSGATQTTNWTTELRWLTGGRCGLPAIGGGRERVEFRAPAHGVLAVLRGSRPALLTLPATISRSAFLIPVITRALPPGCPFGSNPGGRVPTVAGGCGTVPGSVRLRLEVIANPTNDASFSPEALRIGGRFTSTLGTRLFARCRPGPPAAVAAGQLLTTTWDLEAPALAGSAHFTMTTGCLAVGPLIGGAACLQRYLGSPSGSSIVSIGATFAIYRGLGR